MFYSLRFHFRDLFCVFPRYLGICCQRSCFLRGCERLCSACFGVLFRMVANQLFIGSFRCYLAERGQALRSDPHRTSSSSFRFAKIDIFDPCTELMSLFSEGLFLRSIFTELSLRTRWFKKAVFAGQQWSTTLNKSPPSSIWALAFRFPGFCLASWSEGRIIIISKDIIERKIIFVCWRCVPKSSAKFGSFFFLL